LEQAHVRFLWGRGQRLELVAGLSFALVMPVWAMATGNPRSLATETSLTAETHDVNGHTEASLTVTVTAQDGQPTPGMVAIADQGQQIAGAALDPTGHATATLSLPPGEHSLTAFYVGNNTHQSSTSQVTPVRAVTGTTADFAISVSPGAATLTQGQSTTITATVAPVNASALTAPMFVTLSCSGLPDQSSCTFTPENLEILPNAITAVTSSMNLATVAQGQVRQALQQKAASSQSAWAVLLPGVFSLVGLAFGARRKRWLSRLSVLGLLGLVAVLGTTGCNPLYNFRHHGPSPNLPTPPGTYTLLVTAQSSNGITAITHSTTMTLTVQ
jgi:hypothetical protein